MNWSKLKKNLIRISSKDEGKNIWEDRDDKISRHLDSENIITFCKGGRFEIERYQISRTIPPRIDFLPTVKATVINIRFLKSYLKLLESRSPWGTFSEGAKNSFFATEKSSGWERTLSGAFKLETFTGYNLLLCSGSLFVRFCEDDFSLYEDPEIDLSIQELRVLIDYLEECGG